MSRAGARGIKKRIMKIIDTHLHAISTDTAAYPKAPIGGHQSHRKGIDVEVLARAIHCMHVGYFLARYIFLPDRGWDDANQIDKMADILSRGSSRARSSHR